MGYARNFQPPSFFNPFSGYYGANTGMGGFQSQFGGFQQPQFGGFGGFQQPQYGGFQQDGFGGQFNRFTRRGQEYTQPYMPQPQPPQMPPDFGSGMGGFGGFNPMMGGLGGFGRFGGFQQRGTVDQNMNNPAFKQQQDAYNMTDYQRLMQRKDRAANAPPAPPMSGMTGLGGMPIRAPSDTEIANSLGFKSPNTGIYMQTDYNPERNRRLQQQDEVLAKEYLSSIGYGQSGFDPSKYEVKREVQPFSGIGSLFSGFGRGFA
jgi:hypothetical protein